MNGRNLCHSIDLDNWIWQLRNHLLSNQPSIAIGIGEQKFFFFFFHQIQELPLNTCNYMYLNSFKISAENKRINCQCKEYQSEQHQEKSIHNISSCPSLFSETPNSHSFCVKIFLWWTLNIWISNTSFVASFFISLRVPTICFSHAQNCFISIAEKWCDYSENQIPHCCWHAECRSLLV